MQKGKDIKMKSIKIVCVSICFISVLYFSACGTNKLIKEEANKIIEAVDNKDIATVNKLIFPTSSLQADDELADFFSSDIEKSQNGIIAKIISQDSIKLKKVEKEVIIYEVTASDLSNIFIEAQKNKTLTDENFEKYVIGYIDSADKVTAVVEVKYAFNDGKFSADYANEEFINALTGNLLVSYRNLSQQMISEFNGEALE